MNVPKKIYEDKPRNQVIRVTPPGARASSFFPDVDTPPRGRGRPTKFRPEYCELLIQHGRQGLSFESFAGKVGVSVETVINWAHKQPEFLEAKKTALGYIRLWHEELLNLIATQGGPLVLDRRIIYPDGTVEEVFRVAPANVVAVIWAMKNRLNDVMGSQWKDRHEISTPVGQPIQHEHIHKLGDTDLRSLVRLAKKFRSA